MPGLDDDASTTAWAKPKVHSREPGVVREDAYGEAREALDQAETDCRIGRFERCGDDLKVASKYDPDAARSDEAKQLSQQVQEGNDLREMNAKPGMLPRRR